LDGALELARAQHAQAVAAGDLRVARQWERRLAQVRDYDPHALLLPADPRHARYALVRGREAFVLDHGLLVGWGVLEDDESPMDLLRQRQPRTTADDVEVVLRWFGAQRGARLVHLPDDDLLA